MRIIGVGFNIERSDTEVVGIFADTMPEQGQGFVLEFVQFGYGAVVMGAALFVGGCPTRIIIRTGYGDLAGLIALGGVAAGIVLATLSLRWVARR